MIDLFSGIGGWAEGGLAEGYDVVGFDIERHVYGEHRYPAQLVLQDVLTLHGSQFREAALIVASPPCQKYSYMAMPWTRAKDLAKWYRDPEFPERLVELNALFDACFRIQREASEAAGRRIPMVVENVRGANEWVGRSRWNFGSFHLWGDVPALMPTTFRGFKSVGMNWSDQTKRGQDFTRIAGRQAMVCDCQCPEPISGPAMMSMECPVHNWNPDPPLPETGRKGIPHRTAGHWTNPAEHEGVKRPGISFSEEGFNVTMARKLAPTLKEAKYRRTENDKRQHIGINRKAASAMIAKIPLPLARHIARVYRPEATC